jgi:hypothetical protein
MPRTNDTDWRSIPQAASNTRGAGAFILIAKRSVTSGWGMNWSRGDGLPDLTKAGAPHVYGRNAMPLSCH